MEYDFCIEEMEGRWIAHMPPHFGCYCTAPTTDLAVAGLPAAWQAYWQWRQQHGDASDPPESPAPPRFGEIHRAWKSAPDYEVNAFFAADAAALTVHDVELALQLLAWTRADLLAS